MTLFDHARALVITIMASTATLISALPSNIDARPLRPGGSGFDGPTRGFAPFALHRPLRMNRPRRMPASPHPWYHPFSPGRPTSAAASTKTPLTRVVIAGMRFQPSIIHIKAGDEVTWINHEPLLHIISSPNYGLLASEGLVRGSEFTHTFKEPGTYTYYCTLNRQMTGMVIVE